MTKATLKIDIWNHSKESIAEDVCELSERLSPHAEHVARMLDQGYVCGQIVDDKFDGWWTIEHD